MREGEHRRMGEFQRVDDSLMVDVNHLALHTAWLHSPLVDYAHYGVVLFAVLLLSGLFLAKNSPSPRLAAAGWTPLAMLIALALNQLLGRWVAEPRPYQTHPQLLVLGSRTSDFAFPSDHAVMAGAVAAGLLLVSRRLGVIASVAAGVMAFSRVYIGAHYPWDVLAGLLLAAAVTVLGWLLLQKPLTALTEWLRQQRPLQASFVQKERAGM
jgi:membrane-associated phospholipid phosphatase